MSEAQVNRLLEAQRKEYERKRQEETYNTVQRKFKEVANTAGQLRQNQNEAIIAAQKKLQEEAASIAAQRKLQEEVFITVERKLQEEAVTLAAQRKLQEEAFIAAQKKLHEEAAQAATQRKLQEKAFLTAQRKLQEEASKRKHHEEAANRKLQEEAAKRKHQEEAAKRVLQEEGAKRALQEEAAKRKYQEETAKRALQEEVEKRKYQEEAAKRTLQEEAAKRTLQEEAARRKHQEEAAKRGLQEEAARRKHQEEAAKRAFQEKVATRTRALPRKAGVLRYCCTCYTGSLWKMFVCENGHGSCNDCKYDGRACGICRRNLTNRRSYDIENHGAQTKAPCPHAWQGCMLLIKIADMKIHVQECPFKLLDCPLAAVFGNCRWLGRISKLSSHFADRHPHNLLTKVSSELYVRNIHNDSRNIWLVKLGYYHFIFHMKISKNDSKVYMAVQFIGMKISAMKWLYEIHIYKKSENRRKYMYTDNCRSSIDNMDDVFKSGECAVLPMWYANTFFSNELTFKFFIKRSDNNTRGFDKNQRGTSSDYSEEEEEDNGWSGSCTSMINERDIRQQPGTWRNSRNY